MATSTSGVSICRSGICTSYEELAYQEKKRVEKARDEAIQSALTYEPSEKQKALIDAINILANQAYSKIDALVFNGSYSEMTKVADNAIEDLGLIRCKPINRSPTDALFATISTAVETAGAHIPEAISVAVGAGTTYAVWKAQKTAAANAVQNAKKLFEQTMQVANDVSDASKTSERIAKIDKGVADRTRNIKDAAKELHNTAKKEFTGIYTSKIRQTYPMGPANQQLTKIMSKQLVQAKKAEAVMHSSQTILRHAGFAKQAKADLASNLNRASNRASDTAYTAHNALQTAQKKAASVVVPAAISVSAGTTSGLATHVAIQGAKALGSVALKAFSIPSQVLLGSTEAGAADLPPTDQPDVSMVFLAPPPPPLIVTRQFGRQLL